MSHAVTVWRCPHCLAVNRRGRVECHRCETHIPAGVSP